MFASTLVKRSVVLVVFAGILTSFFICPPASGQEDKKLEPGTIWPVFETALRDKKLMNDETKLTAKFTKKKILPRAHVLIGDTVRRLNEMYGVEYPIDITVGDILSEFPVEMQEILKPYEAKIEKSVDKICGVQRIIRAKE